MLKVKISETEFEYLNALETEEFYNGASRRTLTITCAPDAISLDTLNALLTEENLASITMTNTEGIPSMEDEGMVTSEPIMNIYEGYVLKLSCGINKVLTETETPETPAVYSDRLVFKIGRRTYIEEQLHKLGL